jgi:hypothetical protein
VHKVGLLTQERPLRNAAKLKSFATQAIRNKRMLQRAYAAYRESVRLIPRNVNLRSREHGAFNVGVWPDFGLIRHRWWGYQFCKKKCLNDFLAKRAQQIARVKEWLAPHRTSDGEASRLPSR